MRKLAIMTDIKFGYGNSKSISLFCILEHEDGKSCTWYFNTEESLKFIEHHQIYDIGELNNHLVIGSVYEKDGSIQKVFPLPLKYFNKYRIYEYNDISLLKSVMGAIRKEMEQDDEIPYCFITDNHKYIAVLDDRNSICSICGEKETDLEW